MYIRLFNIFPHEEDANILVCKHPCFLDATRNNCKQRDLKPRPPPLWVDTMLGNIQIAVHYFGDILHYSHISPERYMENPYSNRNGKTVYFSPEMYFKQYISH